MGTLDREKKTYEWVSKDGFACKVFSAVGSVTTDELYRLACEVEDLKAEAAKPTFLGIDWAGDFVSQTLKRNADLENSNARLTAAESKRNQERADANTRARSLELSVEDLWTVRREQEAALARQEATIKSLREQLLAANEKPVKHSPMCGCNDCYVREYLELDRQNATLADHGAVLRSHGIAIQGHGGKIDEHESKIQTHEARLDAMEEVFDKIKDAL